EDTGSDSLNGSVLLGIDQLDLEPAVERLHYCIIPAVTLPAHAGQTATRANHVQVLHGAELDPAIRVDDQPGLNVPVCEGHAERVHCELLRHRCIELPAYDGPGIEIHHRGRVQPASVDPAIGEVRDPLLVRALCADAAAQKVVRDIDHRRAGRAIVEALATACTNPAQPHDIGHKVPRAGQP